MLHIPKKENAMLRVWDEKKAKLTLTLFWYFVWPQKLCLDGPLLDSFIILRDPRKRKGENISLDQRRKKGKSDRKRPKRQLLVATALDWSLCLGRSGRCPGQQLPAFTTKFPPDFTSSPHFGSNFDPKHGDRDSIQDTLYIGWWEWMHFILTNIQRFWIYVKIYQWFIGDQ